MSDRKNDKSNNTVFKTITVQKAKTHQGIENTNHLKNDWKQDDYLINHLYGVLPQTIIDKTVFVIRKHKHIRDFINA